MKKAEQIICPSPMPESPVDARLAGLLVPALNVVLEKKAKKKATGTRRSSRRQVVSDSSFDDSAADSSPEGEEEEEDSLPEEGERKRKASPTGEAEGSKRGRTIPPDSSAQRQRWRRRVALKGQASGKIVSIRIPELFLIFLLCHIVSF